MKSGDSVVCIKDSASTTGRWHPKAGEAYTVLKHKDSNWAGKVVSLKEAPDSKMYYPVGVFKLTSGAQVIRPGKVAVIKDK